MNQSLPRRAKGTGTISCYRGGYRALFPFTPGKREVVAECATYEEAEKALEAILVDNAQRNGGLRGTPLKRIVEKMIGQRRAQGYASVDGEESDWDSYFAKSRLAERPVQHLTQGEVMDAILAFKGRTARNKGQPLSLSTRKKLLNIIRAALYVAKQDGLVEHNILADARFADPKGKGKRKKRAKRALTWEQFLALADASKSAPEIDIALWTGCRQGELRALQWVDVHNVEGSACTCDEHREDPHIVVRYSRPGEVTKSGEIGVVSLFGRGLEAFRTLPRNGRKKDGSPSNPHGIVFVSRLGEYRAKGRLVGRKKWTEWKRAAALPAGFRWHDLRHTCGTWLVKCGWSLEAVKEHLRHSELKTTERYADQRGGSVAAGKAAEMRDDKRAIGKQGTEKLSHLGGLNPGPTVYESQSILNGCADLSALASLALSYLEAVREESPFSIAKGTRLAEAVLGLSNGTKLRTAAS